jgi:UTP--glucose-1-phosphate uridylyltransferase
MMPIVDKPLIQYAVEEAVAAGIRDMVFITGRTKRSIEDHFDKAYEVEAELVARGKSDLLGLIQGIIPKSVNCIYIRQSEPLGLGHAVLCAQPINDEVFAVILADDLIDGTPPVLQQMTEAFERHQSPMVAVQRIPREQSLQYGMVKTEPVTTDLDRVMAIVEKPRPEAAPSNLAVVGRYILTPRIFHHLAQARPGARFSSPTRSPRCSRKIASSRTASKGPGTIADRSSATCRPPSRTGAGTLRSERRSRSS